MSGFFFALNNQPIGIFDSGIGGLSIWKCIRELLPNESTIYIADSANAPYGDKSPEEIVYLSVKSTEKLIGLGAKIIVVACNTATTNAIRHLRDSYPLPFVGIEPATKPAAIQTKTGKIGILATKGTLASELFLNTSKQYRGSVEIIETVGAGLVQIVESGDFNKAKSLLRKYLEPLVEAGVDNIVLGCTHYPFLKGVIQEIIPDKIKLIDSGNAVAKRTEHLLLEHSNLSEALYPTHQIFTSGDPVLLKKITQNLFDEKIGIHRF